MTKSMAVRGEAEDPRAEALVEAAYHLLDEAGLDGLTIRAVLARTGLARRAFYDNFAGKDDLVLAVFARTLRQAAVQLGAWSLERETPLERLRFMITSIVMGRLGVEETPPGLSDLRGAALSREHMRLAESRPAELHAALAPLLGVMSGHLADGIAAGEVRDTDPARLARLVYNLVATTVHTELLAEEASVLHRPARAQLADELWAFCAGAIAA